MPDCFDFYIKLRFYARRHASAIYAIVVYGVSVCLSVCLSHSANCIITAKPRIMQIMPHDSLRNLVF